MSESNSCGNTADDARHRHRQSETEDPPPRVGSSDTPRSHSDSRAEERDTLWGPPTRDCDVAVASGAASISAGADEAFEPALTDIRIEHSNRKSRAKIAFSDMTEHDICEHDIELFQRLQVLLKEGASLTHAPAGTTALHWWLLLLYLVINESSTSFAKTLEEMLAIAEGSGNMSRSEILNYKTNHKGANLFDKTLLGMAIGFNNFTAVKALVVAGADTKLVSNEGDTALHLAVEHPDILKFFLTNYDVPNRHNEKGYWPIHRAAMRSDEESVKLLLDKFEKEQLIWKLEDGSTIWHIIARNNSIEIAEYLLHEYFDDCPSVNKVNSGGETPVLESARHGNMILTGILLRNGATLSCKGARQTPIELITKNLNDPSKFFEDLFDTFIDINDNPIRCINVCYTVLTHSSDESQIEILEELVLKCGDLKLLRHPMIESLIYLKWKCLQPEFWFSIFLYMLFLIALNIYLIRTFSEVDAKNMEDGSRSASKESRAATCGLFDRVLIAFLYIFIAVLIIQEFMWMCQRRLLYFSNVDSSKKYMDVVSNKSTMEYLKWGMEESLKWCLKLRKETYVRVCVLALGAAVPALVGCAGAEPEPWRRHVACAALLLAWLQAMLLLARCPGWGYYFHMFERVAFNIFKIFVTTIGLVFAFSACFMIEYQSAAPFDGPVAAFIKTLVMMSSEFDYEGLFDDKHAEIENRKYFVYYLFLSFLFFIALALMNLMIGVAVSDVKKLKAVSHVRRLARQVELLSAWQGLEKTFLGKWPKKLACIRHHKEMIHTENSETARRKWIVGTYIRTHDYEYEESLTKELHDAIYRIVKKKQNANKSDTMFGEEAQRNEKIYKNSRAMPLKNMIKTIEVTYKEIKQCIDDINKWNERIPSVEERNNEIKQFMSDIKKLKDRMTLIEKGNNEIKESMSGLKTLTDRIDLIEMHNDNKITSLENSNKEMKQYMNRILEIVTNVQLAVTVKDKDSIVTTKF